jgi:hypothetical protein
MSYCKSCGAQLGDGGAYCPACGEKIAEPEENKTEDVESDGEQGWRILSTGFGVVWAVTGLATMATSVIGGLAVFTAGLIAMPQVRERLDIQLSGGAVAVVVITSIFVLGIFAPPLDTNTSPSPDVSDNGGGTNTPTSTNQAGFQIRIEYSGEWSGAASLMSESRTIQGTGTQTIDITGSPNVISANAQKQDSSRETLTIQILHDGEVVQESQTDAQYGVASVTHSNY